MTDKSYAPFSKKFLSVEIIVPKGVKKLNYQTGQQETSNLAGQRISLQGYRMAAQIVNAGQVQGVEAAIQIYNLPEGLMKSLTGFGSMSVFNYVASGNSNQNLFGTVQVQIFTSPDTTDTVGVGNAKGTVQQKTENKKQMIFWGSLQTAQAIMQGAPDPFIQIQCNTLGLAQTAPASVISYKGAIAASTIAKNIADGMGLSFTNSGVKTILQNAYFYGSAKRQLEDLAHQALFSYTTENGVLNIWPINGTRQPAGQSAVTVSPNTGLIGYPRFAGVGVTFTTIYNPGLRFGDRIYLETSLPNATGYYSVQATAHHLSTEMPGGPWETEVTATSFVNPVGTAST